MLTRLSTTVSAGVLAGVLALALVGPVLAAGQVTEAHAGTRKGTVYEATPAPYAAPHSGASAMPGNSGESAVTPSVSPVAGGSAPLEAGAGVEIITGGSSSAGAARVGRLPVLQ